MAETAATPKQIAMPGLDPAACDTELVNARAKPGEDEQFVGQR